jgi:hypothetical protein
MDSPLIYNPHQMGFLEAKRKRVCLSCKEIFVPMVWAQKLICPLCNSKQVMRAFDKMTLLAGRRGGKTRIGAVGAGEELQIPGSIGWACAPSYPKLHDYVMPAIKKLIPDTWFKSGFAKESIEHKEIKFGNEALVQFRSLDDPDAGRGPGLDWLWIDEACEVVELAFDTLLPTLADKAGVAWITSSPQGFDWVYRRLWVPAVEGVPGFWACRYKTIDNPHFNNPIQRAMLEKDRATMSADRFRQEYEAEFVSFEGSIYQVPSHLILRSDDAVREFIPEWPRIDLSRKSIVGIDTGAKHPFAATWIVSTERGLVAVGEYQESMKSAMQHAQAIKSMVGGHQPRFVIERDPQMQLELSQFGIMAQQVEKGPGSVMAGIDRVKAWMERGQLVFVESRVPRLISQLQSYRFADTDKKSGERGREEVYKLNDDLCDAARYAIMSWPSLPKQDVIKHPLGRDLSKHPIDPSMAATFARLARLNTRDDGLMPVEEHPVGNMGFVGISDEDEGYNSVGSLWG